MDAVTVEVPSSHVAMVSHPAETAQLSMISNPGVVTKVILEAVHGTT
jgi:hypothetical protein